MISSLQVSIIAAVAQNGVIGRDGGIPWHYPADLKWFKKLTLGGAVIMGRNTWNSLPIKPLPKRKNIVISSTDVNHEAVVTVRDLGSAITKASMRHSKIWLIGGARVYEEGISLADHMYLTYVPDAPLLEKSVVFPTFNRDQWLVKSVLISEEDPRIIHNILVRNP